MNFRNFRLVGVNHHQIIEIDYLGEIFDLHNAAELSKFEYNMKESILVLYWDFFLNDNEVVGIRLKFNTVEFFEILPRDMEIPKEENECLEEIILNETIEFKFMGGIKIIVKADEVSFEKGK